MKISEIIKLWENDKKLYVKKSTYSAYLLLIENHINPYFADKEQITEEDVQKFVLTELRKGLSQKSIKDIIIVLKMILKFAVKQKLLAYNEIEIKFPTVGEKTDLEVLNKNDHKKIINYLQENFTFKNLGIYICLSTGMRIGEICGLLWSDIDVENGIIKVRRTVQRIYVIDGETRHTEILIDTPKTKNSIRDIPMTTELYKIIKPLKKVVNNDFYVITNEAKPTEPRTYRNYYERLIKRLGIPKLKFHGLRHSFATRCIESKCDYKTVSVILGHSNISTTLNLYVHPNMEQKKKCIDQMYRALK
jgi:integrase